MPTEDLAAEILRGVNALHERVQDIAVTTSQTANDVRRLSGDVESVSRRVTTVEEELARTAGAWKEKAAFAMGMAEVRKGDKKRVMALGTALAFIAAVGRDVFGILRERL